VNDRGEGTKDCITDAIQMTPQELSRPDCSIEVNMAKLSVLISRFLASLRGGQWNPSAQESCFDTLETWASQLPQDLQRSASAGDALPAEADEAGPVSDSLGTANELRAERTSYVSKCFTSQQ
jgi:hypothetical protein